MGIRRLVLELHAAYAHITRDPEFLDEMQDHSSWGKPKKSYSLALAEVPGVDREKDYWDQVPVIQF